MTIAEQITRAKADYDEVYQAGKKAEYDEFWDSFQDNGKRHQYIYGFASMYWNSTTFRPKYDIRPTQANGMFFNFVWNYKYSNEFDMVEHLNSLGVVMDFSKCTNFASMFSWAYVKRVGVFDTTSATELSATFMNFSCITIDKIICHEKLKFNNTFNSSTNLENITFEGVIGQNGLNLQWSTKLSKASITSIINALSTTTSGLTVTLSKTAVNKAFETSEGANDGSTSTEWTTLIAAKSNWTISLV